MGQFMLPISLTIHWCCGQLRSTPETRLPPGLRIRSVEECSCCVSPQQLKLSRSWSRQAAQLCDKVTLPTFQGLWQTEAANHRCRAPDALLSHHPAQNGGASKRKENKNVVFYFSNEKLLVFIRCTRWQWPRNKDVSSQWTVLFYIWSHFLPDVYWEGWGIAARSRSPQEGNSGKYWARMLCRVIWMQ